MFFTVPQSCCAIVERFGRYSRVVRDGLHMKLPRIEEFHRVPQWGKNANRYGWLIELTEQQSDTPVHECQTKDNVDVQANAMVFWQIVDPVKAVYETYNLPAFVQTVGLNALRAEIGKLELDHVFSERHTLNQRIAAELEETAKKWGIVFTRVEIQQINVRDETATAMRQQMEAERHRRAMIAESEGRAKSELNMAEADKQAAVIRAEGRAKALSAMAEADSVYIEKLCAHTTPECAAQILLAQKYIDGFDVISRNPSDKVFLPNSAAGLAIQVQDKATGTTPPKSVLK